MDLASVGKMMIHLQLLLWILFVVHHVHPFPTDEMCARLHLKNGHILPVTQMGIGDRQNYDLVESQLIDKVEYTTGAWEWCVLFICGFNPTSNSSWIRQPVNYYGSPGKSRLIDNAPKDIQAISCGCKMFSCEMDKCENLNTTWEGSDCAILYRESTCFSCYYEPVRIGIGDQFTTVPFDIASLLIRPGYKVTAQLNSLENEMSSYEWSEQRAEVFDIYSRTTNTSTFYCESATKVEGPEDGGGDGDDGRILNLNSGVFYGVIGAVGGIIILSVGTGIFVWRRRGGNHEEKKYKTFEFSREEILEEFRTCLKSLQNNHPSFEFVDESEVLTPSKATSIHPCFEVAFEEIILGDLLGSGQFGRVYKGQLQGRRGSGDDGFDERLDVAIKTTKAGQACRKVVKSFLREIQIHSSLDGHENIVRFVGACSQNLAKRGQVYILTEFCGNGSLKAYLRKEISICTIPSQRRCVDGYVIEEGDEVEGSYSQLMLPSDKMKMLFGWAAQIANGMDFLHSKNIIHADLALRNILLTDQLVAKICDFGLSRCCLQLDDSSQSTSLPEQFPLNSIAPECLHIFDKKKVRVSSFTDIWAFGCTSWELFSLGDQPYFGMDIFQIYEMLASRKHLEKPKFASDLVYGKIVECWNHVPEERPTFPELRTFFKQLNTET